MHFDAIHVWSREAEVHGLVEDSEGDVVMIEDILANLSVCNIILLAEPILTKRIRKYGTDQYKQQRTNYFLYSFVCACHQRTRSKFFKI